MNGLAGAVVWAVVPYVPEAPFRLYAGQDRAPVEVRQAAKVIDAARGGADSEFTFLVPAKARPILVVSDGIDPRLGELIGVRLLRLSTLDARERESVRSGREPSLLHLDRERFDLPEENAVMIGALVRVHGSAVDPRPAGRLDRGELRTVHERVIAHYGLDVHALVVAQLERLAQAQRRRTE